MKVTTAGEKDDEDAGDNPEHDELPPEKTLRPDEVFQKISFRPNMEEQKKLLLFQFQARTQSICERFPCTKLDEGRSFRRCMQTSEFDTSLAA